MESRLHRILAAGIMTTLTIAYSTLAIPAFVYVRLSPRGDRRWILADRDPWDPDTVCRTQGKFRVHRDLHPGYER